MTMQYQIPPVLPKLFCLTPGPLEILKGPRRNAESARTFAYKSVIY